MPAFANLDDVDVVLVLEKAARWRKYNVSSAKELRKRHGLPTCHKMRYTDTDNQAADSGGGTTPEPRSPLSRSSTPSSKSFRAANRLARRARSFKEDFLEKISQMRNTAAVPIGATVVASPTTNSSAGLVVTDGNQRLGGSGRETPTLDGDGVLIGDEMKGGIKMVFGGRRGSPTVKRVIGSGERGGGSVHEYDLLTKQLQTALMYFRSSVANDKLEMLAGNGTIILDTVWAINLAVKSSCTVGIQSNTEMSCRIKEATQTMYHNASRLIKVCDDALLPQEDTVDGKKNELKIEDEEKRLKKKLYRESVEKVLSTLEESVKSLLTIARDSLTMPSPLAQHANHGHHYKTIKPTFANHGHHNHPTSGSQQQLPLLLRPPSPAPGAPSQQRNSLPDIPLTPRERELLGGKQQQSPQQQSGGRTCSESGGECVVDGRAVLLGNNSYSSESVLKDVVDDSGGEDGGGLVAPTKPPLPQSLDLRSLLMSRCVSPPPLPPKKNKFGKYGLENMAYIDQISNNLERSSLRSRSPEDSISLLSASGGSLDSMLNHSREEEEIKSLMEHTDSDTVLENDISDAFVTSHHQHHTTVTSSSSHNSSSNHHVTHQVCGNRLSNTDSGVVSMHSMRNSSCSKRSSVTSSSSNAIKHVEMSNNDSMVRTASIETDSSNHNTHHSTYHQTTSSSQHHHLTSSSSTSNSSSTVSMLSSSTNNNNHIQQQQQEKQHQQQPCRMDSTATTTTTEDDDDDEDMFEFKHMDTEMGGSAEFEDELLGEVTRGEDVPPALPLKIRRGGGGAKERMPSPYDNVKDGNQKSGDFIVTCQMHQSHQSLSSSVSMASSISQDNGKPPPLPPKKRHIMAYMEMFGNCSHANDEFMRHSVHMTHGGNWAATGQSVAMSSTQSCSFSTQNNFRSQSMAVHQMSIDSNQSLSSPSSTSSHIHSHPSHGPPLSKSPLPHPFFTSTPISSSKSPLTSQKSIPPALPPKRLRTASTLATPPPSPPPTPQPATAQSDLVPQQTISRDGGEDMVTGREQQQQLNRMISGGGGDVEDCGQGLVSAQLPDLLEHTVGVGAKQQQLQDPNVTSSGSVTSGSEEKWRRDLMEATDIDDYLVLKKADEDMPDVRGGSVDALIIQASIATRNSDEKENGFSYQEAFLTTYRTFITPHELITKLIRRYYFFYRQTDKKKRFREAFALIVCVVNDLVSSDLDATLHQMLMEFDQSLIADGELVLAKALRIKLLEKHDNKVQTKQILSNQNVTNNNALNMSPIVVVPSKGSQTLLDFKSEQIAEQMTLLDAELFMRIEIPEVLIWVQEQKEETSPNLTRFTEHFNKMSYWARTRILLADARDRERYFVKFIKIMKQLRKINNFNSYLALLSALDSAPIRRLEWQKQVQDGLKEYCALIDSSSSFRAYRQALAETSPPCIPYIGLVLQDLTFVHIGNSNLLPNGAINFSKRWQQFHIVENMKRFKKCSYNFKRNDRIISYFQSFNDYINEDEMWNLSENIKPRGRKAVQ